MKKIKLLPHLVAPVLMSAALMLPACGPTSTSPSTQPGQTATAENTTSANDTETRTDATPNSEDTNTTPQAQAPTDPNKGITPTNQSWTPEDEEPEKEEPSRRNIFARLFDPEGAEPEKKPVPWDADAFMKKHGISPIDETDVPARMRVFHAMVHNMVIERPASIVSRYVERLNAPDLPEETLAAWERNGFILKSIPRDQLELFIANLPTPLDRDSEPIIIGNKTSTIRLLTRKKRSTVLYMTPDDKFQPMVLTSGAAQMLVKIMPPLSEKTIAPVFSFTPHFHGLNSISFTPAAEGDRTKLGYTFDELRIRTDLPKDVVWIIMAKAPKQIEQAELKAKLIEQTLKRNRTTVPYLYENGRLLANIMMNGIRTDGKQVQRLLIIQPHWPDQAREAEAQAQAAEAAANTNATQPEPESTETP